MDMMIPFIEPAYLGYMWLIIAIVFLLAELATPGLFFFVAFAAGSCMAALLAFLEFSFTAQCVSGLVLSVVAFLLLRHYFTAKWKNKIETNIDALVGKTGVVVQKVSFQNIGFVKISGELWSAQTDDRVELQKGTVVTVVAVRGNKVIVKG